MSKHHIRQTLIEASFNPEDVTGWAELTPIDTIADILPEIMQSAVTIERWADVIYEHPDVDSSPITFGENTTLKEMAEDMKIESQLIARILRTLAAYRKEYRRANGLLDNIEPGE